MRLFLVLIILFSFSLNDIFSQEKHDYVWTIGDNGSSGNPHPDFGGVNLDFNIEPVKVERIERIELSFGTNSSSIANKKGALQFLTDGCFVYGKNNMLIKNGDAINEGQFRNRCTTGNGYISGNASTIFLPNPGNEDEYYLIHQRVDAIGSLANATLLFSIIDTTTDNGLGSITKADLPISSEVRTYLGAMAAVKHANGRDWWVVVPEDSTDIYNLILVDDIGIQKSHDQKMGNKIGYWGIGTGQCKFSPDGKKFARWTETQQLLIADFDRTTGTFSNDMQINVLVEGTRGGTEFSPNSRFLYVSTDDYIFQYDFEENDFSESKILVAEYDGFIDFLPTSFDRMQITPDCRIFINLPGSHRFWHIIHSPNEKGIACNVEQRGLPLKTWTFNTMPYFPNYNLGAIGNAGGYPCDSTKITVSSSDIPIFESPGFVYPNPTQGRLRIDLPAQVGQVDFRLFSAAGQLVFSKEEVFAGEEMDLGDLARGIYFYKIFDKKGRNWSGKVIINQ